MSDGDPAVIEPRGKSNAARKGRYDGSYTGTEQRMKDRLMRQFMKTGEGPGGNSDAYRNASCWCACGRLKADARDECQRCIDMDAKAPASPMVVKWTCGKCGTHCERPDNGEGRQNPACACGQRIILLMTDREGWLD